MTNRLITGLLVAAAALSSTTALADTTLAAAVLPNSRTVQVGDSATLFATILNGGSEAGVNCRIEPDAAVPATFSYQTTDPATNQVTGTVNTPVDIAPGQGQSFLVALTPSQVIAAVDVQLDFLCDNAPIVAPITLVNTFTFAATSVPTADIVALAVTPSGDGVVTAGADSGIAAFSVATVNLGVSEVISFAASLSDPALPVTLTYCETDPVSGVCVNPTIPSAAPVTTTIDAQGTPTFAVFVTATGPVPFDPAANRIFVTFDAAGDPRGATSVAVRRAELPPLPMTTALVTGTTLWHREVAPGRVAYQAQGQVFNADGTGVSFEKFAGSFSAAPGVELPETFSWQIVDGVLQQTFTDYVVTTTPFNSGDFRSLQDVYGLPEAVWLFLENRFNNDQFVEPYELEKTTVSRSTMLTQALTSGYLTESSVTEFYSVDAMLQRNGWTDPLPDGVPQQRTESQAFTEAPTLAQAPGQTVAAGESWVVSLPFTPMDPQVVTAEEGYNGDLLVFNADGSAGSGIYSNSSFSWTNAGQTLVLTTGNVEHRFTSWQVEGAQRAALVEYRVGGDLLLVTSLPMAKLEASADTLAAALPTSGTQVWQAGINTSFTNAYLPSGLIRPDAVFGYSFQTATDSDRIIGYGAGSGICPDDTQSCFGRDTGYTWQANGNVITRSRSNGSSDRTRTWHVLSYTGGTAIVLEAEVAAFGGGDPEFLIPPRLNLLEQIDLVSWPAELANSPDFP